jgi:transposase
LIFLESVRNAFTKLSNFKVLSCPDLKQLLLILTMSADGNVPVAFRCTDGNASDSRTHIETWNALRSVAGRADFLYVADSKLRSRENMDYIDRAGGRFVTVLPRTRLEDPGVSQVDSDPYTRLAMCLGSS